MTGFAAEMWDPQSAIHPFLYGVGSVFGFTAMALIVASAIGIFQRETPRVFMLYVEILAVLMAVCSAILSVMYAMGLWAALQSPMGFQAGFGVVNFFSLYAVLYWLSVATLPLPQLFWWRRFRTRFSVVLVVALVMTVGIWWEKVLILITSGSQDFLPASWSKHY